MRFFSKYGIGLMVLIAWMAQAVPLLMTEPKFAEITAEVQTLHANAAEELRQSGGSPPQSGSMEAMKNTTIKELKSQWILGATLIAAGIVSSVLALFHVRFWKFAVMCTSLMYLIVWYSSGSLSSIPPITAFQLKWMTAKTLGLETNFFIKDVTLPIFYFFMTVFLAYKSARRIQ
ncbi:hypothetical protein [Paraherbaspirillum soli]|uniref:Uncharacterized protein n=1 Tax=Paraherbaspirillum soli TaxID=631222 RepID=A0ABW0MCI0_9BURK